MPVLQQELEIKRIRNLVQAFDWKFKCTELTDNEIIITFLKPRSEPIPEEAVGAD